MLFLNDWISMAHKPCALEPNNNHHDHCHNYLEQIYTNAT